METKDELQEMKSFYDDVYYADAEKPLEVLRTVHSFDPCIACAVHMLDPDGKEVSKVKVI